MPRLCRFTAPETKETTFVNPSTIRFVRRSGSGTAILFGGDHVITVLEDLETVVNAVEDVP